MMHAIHLVDSLDRVNFGVWNAVIANFPYLNENGIKPLLWSKSGMEVPEEARIFDYQLFDHRKDFIQQLKKFNQKTTIIVSHGCWKFPTLWGYQASGLGFNWFTLPHGMLEPWSMQQKWLKKKIYFHLIEKPRLQKAHEIIAVGKEEQQRLSMLFGRSVLHFPNGIEPYLGNIEKPADKVKVLFMARLHHKKGVLPLLQAWNDSSLAGHSKYELNIAGPDDGELLQIEQFLAECPLDNVNILGPVYAKDKIKLLKASHIYLLPSQSEGFPTSILEAATYGCYPVFTRGCNFNEAFEAGVARQIAPEAHDIRAFLDEMAKLSLQKILSEGLKAKTFVDKHYNLQHIGQSYLDLFEKSLPDISSK